MEKYKYSTYGKQTLEVVAGQTEINNDRTYTGRELETQLPSKCFYYYRARYYKYKLTGSISRDFNWP
jgi:hypothetical protein